MIEASKLIGVSFAPGITTMYDNVVKSFDNFRISHNLPVTWPSSINQLFQYIGYMSVNGFAPSTVRSHMSGISFNLKIQGLSNLINLLLKRCKKRCDIRKPITLDILTSSKYEVVMFKTTFHSPFRIY